MCLVVSSMLFFLTKTRLCNFALHGLECAEGRSPGAWVSALVAWLLCSAISGKGERSHQPRIFPIFLVLSRYCILKLFEVLGLTRFFEFCPLSGSSGARLRGSSLTRHDGSGCCPYPNGWNASRLVQNRHRAFSPT